MKARLKAVAVVVLFSACSVPGFVPALAASRADVIAATYGAYSVLPPTPSLLVVCHGFDCNYRAEVALTDGDRAVLARLLNAGKASAAAERQALGRAGAWFDRRIGNAAGTQGHVARAGVSHMFDSGQFDCIDSSRNMTSLLLVLDQLKLLRHHTVDVPVSRGLLIDGRPLHVSAVIREKATDTRWTVDSWTRAYGEAPEIMPLARWMTLN